MDTQQNRLTIEEKLQLMRMAQYYSDNLRTEVLKGIDERSKQGWQHGLAPFGYVNVSENREEPIQPHPENAKAVMRMFELYSSGQHTFESVGQRLAEEGFTFRDSQSRFNRTAVSYILNNRFYIGEIRRGKQQSLGRHQPLVDRTTFLSCQDLLKGKARKTKVKINLPFSGGLFTCQHCGAMITGERIKRKLKGGGVRVHDYYRCANNSPEDDHPSVRWRGDDLEDAIIADLESLRMPDEEVTEWFRSSLQSAFSEIGDYQRKQRIALTKRKSELNTMNDRLLNTFLTGAIDEATFNAKLATLRDELAQVEETLASDQTVATTDVRAALEIFDFSQKIAEIWRGSKMPEKRRILEAVSLNRILGDVSLVIEKRKPFDEITKRSSVASNRGNQTRLELFGSEFNGWPATLMLSMLEAA